VLDELQLFVPYTFTSQLIKLITFFVEPFGSRLELPTKAPVYTRSQAWW
jgi:hypothetical protein